MGSQPRSKTRAARCSTGPVFGLASEECRTVARRQRGLGALGTEQKPEARVPSEPPTLSLHPGATQLVLRLAGVLLRRELVAEGAAHRRAAPLALVAVEGERVLPVNLAVHDLARLLKVVNG